MDKMSIDEVPTRWRELVKEELKKLRGEKEEEV